MVESGGIRKRASLPHRGIGTLSFSVGVEGIQIEGDNVRSRGLCPPNTLNRWMEPFNFLGDTGDDTDSVRTVRFVRCLDRGLNSGGLTYEVPVPLKTKCQIQVGYRNFIPLLKSGNCIKVQIAQ